MVNGIKSHKSNWGYELVENDLWFFFFVHIKMSYYWFNRQALLQKAKGRYHNCCGKEKAAEYYAEYYLENKEVVQEKATNDYRDLSEEEKETKKEYGRKKQIQKHERK